MESSQMENQFPKVSAREMSKDNENGKPADLVFDIGTTVHGYKLISKIDEGGFGQVFKVSRDKKFYAMKLESNAMAGGSAIKLEMSVFNDLPRDSVFPAMVAGGKKPKFHFLVLELLGDNLRALRMRSTNPEMLSDGTWSRLGIQCLYALKKMHDAGYVHRDVKPNNFAIAVNTTSDVGSRRIMLFDFGLARKFMKVETKKPSAARLKSPSVAQLTSKAKGSIPKRSAPKPRTARQTAATQSNFRMLKAPSVEKIVTEDAAAAAAAATHIYTFRKPRPRTDFRGTEQYASPNAHDLKELGRTDDVWSLLYMVAEFFLELPWNSPGTIPVEEIKRQCPMVRVYTDADKPGRLTSEMVQQLGDIDQMLKSRNYYQAPDYHLVHTFFLTVMKKAGVDWKSPYDWETVKTMSTSSSKKSRELPEWEDPRDFFKKDRWANVAVVCTNATTPTNRKHARARSPSHGRGQTSKEEGSRNVDDKSSNVVSPVGSPRQKSTEHP